MGVRLSILIPTLTSRAALLAGLMAHLGERDGLEVLIDLDEGERSIGTKRNALVERARGDYVAFIDDDDWVCDDYVSRVIEATESDPDVIGLRGVMTTDGKRPRTFEHSIRYSDWHAAADGTLCRCPNHINPVRREIAARVPFLELSFGEDKAYSLVLRPLLKTEVMLDEPAYFYRYDPHKPRR